MKCPACNYENAEEEAACGMCRAPLRAKRVSDRRSAMIPAPEERAQPEPDRARAARVAASLEGPPPRDRTPTVGSLVRDFPWKPAIIVGVVVGGLALVSTQVKGRFASDRAAQAEARRTIPPAARALFQRLRARGVKETVDRHVRGKAAVLDDAEGWDQLNEGLPDALRPLKAEEVKTVIVIVRSETNVVKMNLDTGKTRRLYELRISVYDVDEETVSLSPVFNSQTSDAESFARGWIRDLPRREPLAAATVAALHPAAPAHSAEDYDCSDLQGALGRRKIACTATEASRWTEFRTTRLYDLQLMNDKVTVFEFESGRVMAKELARLSSDGDYVEGPGGKSFTTWKSPHLYTKGKIAVLHEGSGDILQVLADELGSPMIGSR